MSHPAQVVSNAVKALDRHDWNTFIDLCDPVSIRRFKRDLVWQFSDHGPRREVTVDDLLEDMPEIPGEIDEYDLAEMERYRDPAKRLSLEISTVSSVEELKSLEPREVLLRWLQARMPTFDSEYSTKTWETDDGFQVTEITGLSREELGSEAFQNPEYVVLGSVRDGPDFAHVVFRHSLHGPDEPDDEEYETPRDEIELERGLRHRTYLHTAACRKQPDGSWLLVADRRIFFMAMMSIVDPEVQSD